MRPDESRAFLFSRLWVSRDASYTGARPQAGASLQSQSGSSNSSTYDPTGSLAAPARQSLEVPSGHGAQSSCKRGTVTEILLEKS